MVKIIGNGMGESDFSNLNEDFNKYDVIICDKSFKEDRDNLIKLPYRGAKDYIMENYEKQNILYVVTG